MEHLNQVELRGFVGSVKIDEVADTHVARFSMATNYIYRDRDGCAVIETTWHSVTAWQGPDAPNLNELAKGDIVHVIGRLRQRKYTTESGEQRSTIDVLAHSVELIADEKE